MGTDKRADRVAEIARLAQRPVPADATAVQEVMRRVRQPQRPWLLTPRLSPAMAGAMTVVAAAAGALLAPRANQPVSNATETAVTPVAFVLVAQDAREVALVGDFNEWQPGYTLMSEREGGVWSVVVPLAPGRYNYAFLVDGQRWVADPGAATPAEEDYGRPSSVVFVEEPAS